MKRLALSLCIAAAGAMSIVPTQALAEKVITGNLRIVIGSTSTGGDTYQNAAIVAEALAKKLDVNVKVDPVGPTAAFQAISRSSDGSTIMLFHDQSYLGYLYGVRGFSDIFTNYMVGPTVAINPGDAFLVPAKSPYKTIDDVIQAAGNGTRVRVAVPARRRLRNRLQRDEERRQGPLSRARKATWCAVNTGSQADKNQLLFDGQADVINGSVQANEQYTRLPADDQKAMRFVWIPARKQTLDQANPEGMGQTTREQLLQFATPKASVTMDGKKNWAFDKEFFFIYNKDMKPEVVAALDKALTEIYAEGKIQALQKKSFFIPNFMPSKEAQAYLRRRSTRRRR